MVSFSAAWAALAARDSWYSRHFLSRFLSPADRFSFPGDVLLLLPCSVRSFFRFWELLFDHVPYRDVDRGARRVLVGVLILINPVGAQPFAGPVRAGPDPPALLVEAVGVSFHPQPVCHCLQAVIAHVLGELEAPGHAAFALGIAVAVVLPPHQPRQ